MSTETKTPYWQLLKDPRWQKKRLEILNRDAFTCRLCGDAEEELHVHHRWYVSGRLPWQYPRVAYLTVCAPCHQDIKKGAPYDCDWEEVVEVCEEAVAGYRGGKNFLSRCRGIGYSPKKMLKTIIQALMKGLLTHEMFFGWRKTMNAVLRSARADAKARKNNDSVTLVAP